MALQSTGLTDVGFGPGLTTNFQVRYEDGLFTGLPAAQQAGVKANLIANCNFLLGVMESAFTTTTGWSSGAACCVIAERWISRKVVSRN